MLLTVLKHQLMSLMPSVLHLRVYHFPSVWETRLRQTSKPMHCKLFKQCVLPTRVPGQGINTGVTRILLRHLMLLERTVRIMEPVTSLIVKRLW